MTTHEIVLDREFLRLRASILNIAAILDRIDRAEESFEPDPRLGLVREAIQMLDSESADRVERIQEVFSVAVG